MPTFKEWLLAQLYEEEIIEEDDFDPDTVTKDELLSCTDLDAADLENYETEYKEMCQREAHEPLWDLEDY